MTPHIIYIDDELKGSDKILRAYKRIDIASAMPTTTLRAVFTAEVFSISASSSE